ncbi:DMT family transporter [Actinoallomurus rhizosphaericola]|uniref:DMT family transporter n=1 Tax=Actinoallomurus rhizosphaericola TaxID=2952536 RepID=UPI0020928700|nr:DMT family transporter [Actinoallomurus rhizosphaericola]MCO5996202.1 DMT family transporter [Actinoallomurus rhizosphaericola]
MRVLSVVGLTALAVIWGTNFLLVEEALHGSDPAQIVLARLWLGGLLLLACSLATRTPLPRRPGVWLRLTGMGLLGQAVPWLLFAWGQESVTSSLAGIYSGATPLMTIPAVWLILRSRSSRIEVVASAIGFAGLFVVLAPWRGTGGSSLTGQLACLGGAACYALAYTYARHLIDHLGYSKLTLATTQALSAGLVMLVVSAPQVTRPLHLTPGVTVSLLLMGIGTAVAFGINYWLIASIGPVQAGLAFYLLPVVAVVIGVTFLDDRLAAHQLTGMAIVFAALAVQFIGQGRPAADPEPPADRPLEPPPADRPQGSDDLGVGRRI